MEKETSPTEGDLDTVDSTVSQPAAVSANLQVRGFQFSRQAETRQTENVADFAASSLPNSNERPRSSHYERHQNSKLQDQRDAMRSMSPNAPVRSQMPQISAASLPGRAGIVDRYMPVSFDSVQSFNVSPRQFYTVEMDSMPARRRSADQSSHNTMQFIHTPLFPNPDLSPMDMRNLEANRPVAIYQPPAKVPPSRTHPQPSAQTFPKELEGYIWKEVLKSEVNKRIHLAICKANGERVTVEEILIDVDHEEQDRMNERCMNLQKLEHYNLARILDYFMLMSPEGDRLFVVVDFCQGENLADKIFNQRMTGMLFNTVFIISWILQILRCLQHLHRKNIVHLDIKPENIYIDSGDRLKIACPNLRTQTRTSFHSPSKFMAPELSDGLVSVKADIWSFGAILYHLLTCLSHETVSPKGNVYRYGRWDFDPMIASMKDFPPAMSEILLDATKSCLLEDPDDRIDADQLLNKLEKFQQKYEPEDTFELLKKEPTSQDPTEDTFELLKEAPSSKDPPLSDAARAYHRIDNERTLQKDGAKPFCYIGRGLPEVFVGNKTPLLSWSDNGYYSVIQQTLEMTLQHQSVRNKQVMFLVFGGSDGLRSTGFASAFRDHIISKNESAASESTPVELSNAFKKFRKYDILIHCSPFLYGNGSGEEVALFLIDCQGVWCEHSEEMAKQSLQITAEMASLMIFCMSRSEKDVESLVTLHELLDAQKPKERIEVIKLVSFVQNIKRKDAIYGFEGGKKFVSELVNSTAMGKMKRDRVALLSEFVDWFIAPPLSSLRRHGDDQASNLTEQTRLFDEISNFAIEFMFNSKRSDHLQKKLGSDLADDLLKLTKIQKETVLKDFTKEIIRILSFKLWPRAHAVEATYLARHGFYCIENSERIVCAFCALVLRNVGSKQQLKKRHTEVSPPCPLLRGSSSVNKPFSVVFLIEEPEQRRPVNPEDERIRALQERVPYYKRQSEILTMSTQVTRVDRLENGEVSYSVVQSDRKRKAGDSILPEMVIVSNVRNYDTVDGGSTPQTTVHRNAMCSELSRLETFKSWSKPAIVSAERLAKAGFFYIGPEDRVQCYSCKGILRNWAAGDDPIEEHSRHFPECPFAAGVAVDNVTIGNGDPMKIGPAMIRHEAKVPTMAIESARVASFGSWPTNLYQRPSDMAATGFFYTGADDQVRCFYCGGVLHNWDKDDDPWYEHARWFPGCRFVAQVRGPQFIYQVHQNARSRSDVAIREHASGRVSPRMLKARLDWPPIREVIKMGHPREIVKSAIEQQLATGDDFNTSVQLIIRVQELERTPDRPRIPPSNTQSETGAESRGTERRTSPPAQPSAASKSKSHTAHEAVVHNAEQPEEDNNESVAPLPKGAATESDDKTEVDSGRTLEEENQRLRKERFCTNCHKNERNVVFLPCGHFVTCHDCAAKETNCIQCHVRIEAKVKTYVP